MSKTVVCKQLSYGLVEIVDTGSSGNTRYSLRINGQIRMSSGDLNYIRGEYDKLY